MLVGSSYTVDNTSAHNSPRSDLDFFLISSAASGIWGAAIRQESSGDV